MTDYAKKYKIQFVRVAYLLMAISLIVSVSCTTMSERRYVENNTFISNHPKMRIKVSSELKYLGEYHSDIRKQATFDMDMKDHKIERVFHIFAQRGSDDSVKRGVVICTYYLPGGARWLSEPFTSEKSERGRLDGGKIEVGGEDWQYGIWRFKNFFGIASDFVQDAGYSTTNKHLAFGIGRIVTYKEDTIMQIYYIEDQRISGFDLPEFMDRGLKAVHFTESESTGSGIPTPQIESTDLKLPFYIFIQQDDKVYEYGHESRRCLRIQREFRKSLS